MDKISVLVPVYNAEDKLRRCLDSIVGQTYSNLEIILVNDGSTDGSLDLLKSYAKQDERISVISQENRGVAATRNVALRNATGEFILFVDADDWIELSMVEKMYQYINRYDGIDIVFCSHDNLSYPDNYIPVADVKNEVWDRQRQQYEFMTHKRMTGMLWNKLIRRSLFEGVRFDEEVGYGEDAQVLWKLLKKTGDMLVTNEVLYHHALNDESISFQKYSPVKYSSIKVWEEINQEVGRDYPDLLPLAKERLVSDAVYSYYEMKKSDYDNKEHMQQLKSIVKKDWKDFLKSPDISGKMKLYTVLIRLSIV